MSESQTNSTVTAWRWVAVVLTLSQLVAPPVIDRFVNVAAALIHSGVSATGVGWQAMVPAAATVAAMR